MMHGTKEIANMHVEAFFQNKETNFQAISEEVGEPHVVAYM